jgi:predicted adenine nucleotide alpha hydrolase (AANH) superfamily ATPase
MSSVKITKEVFHCKCERDECGYEWEPEVVPSRCPKCKSRRWNRSARLSRSKPITFNGETLTISQWAKKLGLSKTAILWRLKEGWPLEQVLSEEDWRYQKSSARSVVPTW